jgi:phenylalanyl-tRNA synthetase alpha subunit
MSDVKKQLKKIIKLLKNQLTDVWRGKGERINNYIDFLEQFKTPKVENKTVLITIKECLRKIDDMPDFVEKNQLKSLIRNFGYLGAIEYLKPLNWVNSGRNQALADSHNKILQEITNDKMEFEKVCVEAYKNGFYRPLKEVIDELRNNVKEPTFEEIIEKFRSGDLKVDKWNFAIQKISDTEWDAYIMGEGGEQCLAHKGGFTTHSEIYNLFINLGVKRIRPGVC